MHGRVRKKDGPTAEERSASRAKALKYKQLSKEVLRARKSGDLSESTCARMLDVVSKLLRINCDAYTLWNYRRDMLLAQEEKFFTTAEGELELTAACLQKQPKSYSTWFHREWTVKRFSQKEIVENELSLCDQFLAADERNFHCWNYRRAMCTLAAHASQLSFARNMLDANFSNYSALHELATALPSRLEEKQAEDLLELVAQAIFTEPDDQSHWWFLEALVRRIHHHHLLTNHLEALVQLQDLEPLSKWPAIARFRLSRTLLLLPKQPSSPSEAQLQLIDDQDSLNLLRQRIAQDLDPTHAAMYFSSVKPSDD